MVFWGFRTVLFAVLGDVRMLGTLKTRTGSRPFFSFFLGLGVPLLYHPLKTKRAPFFLPGLLPGPSTAYVLVDSASFGIRALT